MNDTIIGLCDTGLRDSDVFTDPNNLVVPSGAATSDSQPNDNAAADMNGAEVLAWYLPVPLCVAGTAGIRLYWSRRRQNKLGSGNGATGIRSKSG